MFIINKPRDAHPSLSSPRKLRSCPHHALFLLPLHTPEPAKPQLPVCTVQHGSYVKWELKLPKALQTATACWLKTKMACVWGLPICSLKAKCFSDSSTFLGRAGEFSHSLHSQFSLLGSQELGLFASSQFSIQQHLLCLLSLGIAREQFGFGQGNLRQTMRMHSCVRFQYPFITAEAPEAWFW